MCGSRLAYAATFAPAGVHLAGSDGGTQLSVNGAVTRPLPARSVHIWTDIASAGTCHVFGTTVLRTKRPYRTVNTRRPYRTVNAVDRRRE